MINACNCGPGVAAKKYTGHMVGSRLVVNYYFMGCVPLSSQSLLFVEGWILNNSFRLSVSYRTN